MAGLRWKLDLDSIVIGAGIVGLSIARELRKAGLNVVVLERGSAGREASWAGAGMLSPHGEKLPDAFWAAKAHEALTRYPTWVCELEAETGRKIDYRASGSVEYDSAGTKTEFPDEAIVDPRDIVAALRQNLEIREGTEVREIDPKAAKTIIVAAGAWSGSFRGLPPSVPVRGHLISYDMPPGSLIPILRRGHTYILQRSNGLTIVGSTEENVGFDRTLDREALVDLEKRGVALWPELAGKRPVDAWCGFRPATPSGLPEVGQISGTNVWRAYGHFRNGILLAEVTARIIAEDIGKKLN